MRTHPLELRMPPGEPAKEEHPNGQEQREVLDPSEHGDGEISLSWRGLGRLDRAPCWRDPNTELERAADRVAVEGAHRTPVDGVDPGRVGTEGDADLLPSGHAARESTSGGVRHRGPRELCVDRLAELQHDHAGSGAEPLARLGLRGDKDGVSAGHGRRGQNGDDDHQPEDDPLRTCPSATAQPPTMAIDDGVKYSG